MEVLGLWSKSQEAHGFGGILAVGCAVGGGCGGGYMPLAVYVVVGFV